MKASHLILNEDLLKDYFLNEEMTPVKYLPNFNQINIFVGSNNSGKSRFMRLLMRMNEIKYIKLEKVKQHDEIVLAFNKSNLKQISNKKELKEFQFNISINDLLDENFIITSSNPFGNVSHYGTLYASLKDKLVEKSQHFKKYYIPTLRTAHSIYSNEEKLKKIEEDIFKVTIVNYFSELSKGVDIFTGLHLHKEILNTRNSKRTIRESFEKFENFISENFFDNKKIDIVAEFNKDESLQGNNNSEIINVHIQGDKETRELYRLGDGIQAIIILMYKIFMASEGSFVYIDEPEINLHPGMQRLFLEQINSNKILLDKKLTYIITTHSNHFLDLTIEQDNVSIYAFSPKEEKEGDKQFTIRNVNRGDNSLLKHLGVNNSSVFMANCSIWVEGISDRNYIKAFLKSYLKSIEKTKEFKSIKEDIDFAFFEYSGSNIEHYIFDEEFSVEGEEIVLNDIKALALSNRIFLLADSDNVKKSTKKGRRLSKLEASKKDNFYPRIIWGAREIENLLTNKVWEKVLINFCNKKLVESDCNDIQSKISNALNALHYSNFISNYIGSFLNEIDVNLGNKEKINILNKIYETKENGSFGTFIPKRELSELVLKADLPWSIYEQNSEIVKLTKEIYAFIID